MGVNIEIWSDIACPWCFIGLTRFRRALDAFPHADQVTVRLRSYQLDPTLPESYDGSEADYLSARKGMPVAQVHQMFDRVRGTGAEDGLVLDFDNVQVANSRRAHRLLHAASTLGDDAVWSLEQSLFRAHFTDGESISDADLLVRLGVEAGLDPDAARAALDSPDLDAAVAADISEAATLGVRGVPFFVLADKYGISGAQPTETFTQALTQVWAETHPMLQPLTVPGLPTNDGDACGPDGC